MIHEGGNLGNPALYPAEFGRNLYWGWWLKWWPCWLVRHYLVMSGNIFLRQNTLNFIEPVVVPNTRYAISIFRDFVRKSYIYVYYVFFSFLSYEFLMLCFCDIMFFFWYHDIYILFHDVYMYTYICIYMYIYVYICIYIHIYIYTHLIYDI